MWEVWAQVGGLGRDDNKVRKLAEPETRRRIAPLILAARQKDVEAAELIERAAASADR